MTKPNKAGNFAGILAAAGITPARYQDPEITIDPNGVASYVAWVLDKHFAKNTLPNTVFKNEIDSIGHGFGNYYVHFVPDAEALADHAKLLQLYVAPAAHALYQQLEEIRGEGFLAFTDHTLMTKRKTVAGKGQSGNIHAACFIWIEDRTINVSITVNVLGSKRAG